MTARVCSTPGCPTLVRAGRRGGRCAGCERMHDRARGSRQDRGYDAAYDREHRAYQQRMDQGERFTCWRCAELGRPHEVDPRPGHWHLGHDNTDRSIIQGPQCAASNLDTSSRAAVEPGSTRGISPDA